MAVKMRVYFYGPPSKSAVEQMEYAAKSAGMISVFPEEPLKVPLACFPATLTVYNSEVEFIEAEGKLFPREVRIIDK